MKFENAGSRFPITVSDTESGPTIHFTENRKIELRFVDYRGDHQCVVFEDVIGFKYQTSELDPSGWAEDGPIEVIDSEWLAETCRLDGIDPGLYRHLIVGFNERGMILEILFARLETEAANK